MYRHFFKRLLDIFFSLILLIFLSPLLLLIAILIKIDSKGPVIFKQARIGKDGKVFYIHKARTMVVGAEHQEGGVYLDSKDKRVTKLGKFLRKSSLDELFQLWDVLIGKMSFIGPRPPLTYHPWTIDKYTEEQLKMFQVRPGITGWAQVNGRKQVEWHKRIELNVWYVEHLSFWTDIKIVFMTFFKVFINADNENKGVTVLTEKEIEKDSDEKGVDNVSETNVHN